METYPTANPKLQFDRVPGRVYHKNCNIEIGARQQRELMNPIESIRWVRSTGFGICIGLAIFTTGCTNSASSGVDSTNPDLSRDENRLAGQVSTTGATISEPYCIEITGSDYRWHVRYPDCDGRLADAGEGPIVRDIHVPVQTDVVLVLKSDDYIYTLALPKYGLKEIAVPNLEFRMVLHPPDAGRFPLLGDELCGDPHPDLKGNLIVEPKDRFVKWITDQRRMIENP